MVYVGAAFHENLGDNLLVEGSLRLFQHLNIRSVYCGDKQSRKFVDKCGDDTFARICPRQSCFVYYHPGGNWGDLWSGVQDYREHVLTLTSHLRIATISGPQTIFFHDDASNGSFNDKVNRSHIALIWRQHVLCEWAKRLYPDIKSFEFPDMAFNLGLLPRQKPPEYDVVIHFRDDKESLIKHLKEISHY